MQYLLTALLVALPALNGVAAYDADQLPITESTVKHRVPVTLGVMSKCPDARVCESVFDDVIKTVGHGMIDIRFSFIGNSEPKYGVSCKHGVSECTANVQELCAAKYTSGSWEWWPFVQCLNAQKYEDVGSDAIAQFCANKVGLDWVGTGASACTHSIEGGRLLRQSVGESEVLGITRSCTIIINGKVRCVRDGEWKECKNGHSVDDFVDQVKREYKKLNA